MGLNLVYGAFCITFISEEEMDYDELTRQKFYEYLLPILKSGKLKIQVADEVKIPIKKENLKDF